MVAKFFDTAPNTGEGWLKVYDLSEDTETVDLIRHASLQKADFGFVPDVAIFGSEEWWAAIRDGRIKQHTLEGTISRVLMAGHGDWPEVEVQSAHEVTRWTRVGNQGAYVVGKPIRIEYVHERPKRAMQSGPVKQVLAIWIKSGS